VAECGSRVRGAIGWEGVRMKMKYTDRGGSETLIACRGTPLYERKWKEKRGGVKL